MLLPGLLACGGARCGLPSGGHAAGPAPIVPVKLRLVDARTGSVVGKAPVLPGLDVYLDEPALPEPAPDGEAYALGPRFMLTGTPPLLRERPGAHILDIATVAYDEDDGRRRWSQPIVDPLPPTSIGVAEANGVVAFLAPSSLQAVDATTGAPRWSIPGQHHELLAFAGLLVTLATGVEGAERDGLEVIARHAADGTVAFRIPLRVPDAWRVSLSVCDEHLLVAAQAPQPTLLVDARGALELEAPPGIAAATRLDGDWLLVGDDGLMRMGPGAEVRWIRAPALPERYTNAGFVRVAVGSDAGSGTADLVVFQCEPASDSGVGVLRVSPAGEVRWTYRAAPLGVMHSEYRHDCYLRMDGDEVVVVSQGSSGSFVERVRASDGKSEARWRFDDP